METKRKQVEPFYLFRGLHCTCFFNEIFPGLLVNFFILLSHIPHKKSEELPLDCLFEVFNGLWLSTPTFCIKDYDYVKHFVRVLVLLVINTECLKKFLKKWGAICLFEVFNGLWLSTPTFCIKDYDYVKHFVRVLVLLVINTECLKKFLKKWGALHC